jgi:hypothetical protein
MVRALAMAFAIVLVNGFGPASAQSGKPSCEAVCLKGRCAPGNVDYNQSICMSKCVQACEMGRQKHK